MSEHWQYYTDDGLVHFYHNGIEVGIDRVFDMLNMQDQRIAELEVDNAKLKKNNEHMLDCIFEYETIAPDGQLGVSLLNMDNHIRSLEADNAELKRKLAKAEQKQREAESIVERLIEAGKKLSIIALLNTREDIETWERWHALVAEWNDPNE